MFKKNGYLLWILKKLEKSLKFEGVQYEQQEFHLHFKNLTYKMSNNKTKFNLEQANSE